MTTKTSLQRSVKWNVTNSIYVGSRKHRRRKLFLHFGRRRILLATFCGRFIDADSRLVGNRKIACMDWSRNLGTAALRKLGLTLREIEASGKHVALQLGLYWYDVYFHPCIGIDVIVAATTFDCDPGRPGFGEIGFVVGITTLEEWNHRINFALDCMLSESWRSECAASNVRHSSRVGGVA